ncbi:MAG: hypothetical protein KF705_14355 [Phycisphaeraceae bacterium]|nr:hypothetical protein [Phycisphaeraceae bacterium]
MALILLGIDEAGYGPLLGPLSVGAAALRAGNWSDGDPAPDFWKLLSTAVCKEPREAKGANPRIPVADSKKLKLANSVTTRHPLVHLERAVLSFMRFAEGAAPDLPADDAALFDKLGVELERRPWYQEVKPTPVPVGSSAQSIAIGSNSLGAALENASVDCLGLWCRTIGETRFNTIVGETGSKAEATALAIGEYLRMAFEKWGSGKQGELRIVCDRQGGRTDYAPMLARECRSRSDGDALDRFRESARRVRPLLPLRKSMIARHDCHVHARGRVCPYVRRTRLDGRQARARTRHGPIQSLHRLPAAYRVRQHRSETHGRLSPGCRTLARRRERTSHTR